MVCNLLSLILKSMMSDEQENDSASHRSGPRRIIECAYCGLKMKEHLARHCERQHPGEEIRERVPGQPLVFPDFKIKSGKFKSGNKAQS